MQALMDSEDWDPGAYDAAMQSAFGEDYYQVSRGPTVAWLCVLAGCQAQMAKAWCMGSCCIRAGLALQQADDEEAELLEGEDAADGAQPVGRDRTGARQPQVAAQKCAQHTTLHI